jgi:hypothetical protein
MKRNGLIENGRVLKWENGTHFINMNLGRYRISQRATVEQIEV